ncbi:winged helix-turn-helix domain-containing protein [Agrilactobacillus fermenti]|uniref:winged helix-turn-helix domain-containing protein n=1 Tax=Agrilactobacillus fermenti TaxID=2586909 RepID=UPI001E55EE80|nr:winged helix-turn-helix domain-containing protein [Agrilactobacillus fermenti]MCD2255738.1 winged helix-turn-helix transcriptional regulator [Agrilactobacillus fermenti]
MRQQKLSSAQEAALKLFKNNLEYFNLFGNDIRRKIVMFFWAHLDSGFSTEEIVAFVGGDRAKVVYHINKLQAGHLLFCIREGHQNVYYLDLDQTIEKLETLVKLIQASYPNSTAAKVSRKLAHNQ